MRTTISILFILFVSVLFSPAAYPDETYFVQSVKAKVMAGPNFKAKVIGEASKGTPLAGRGREGNWMRVQFSSHEGYVSALLLSKRAPLKPQGFIKTEDADIKQGVRRRASTYTSAAAARGLGADDRRRLSAAEKADYTSLDRMEAFSLPQDEITKFASAKEDKI